MDKNAFFSVSDLNTDREKANDLSVYAFKVLFKIFAAASLVMWALTPLVCFFDRTTDAIRDVLCVNNQFSDPFDRPQKRPPLAFSAAADVYRRFRRFYLPSGRPCDTGFHRTVCRRLRPCDPALPAETSNDPPCRLFRNFRSHGAARFSGRNAL